MQSDSDAYCRFDAAMALTLVDDAEALQAVNQFRRKPLLKLFKGKERKRNLRKLDATLSEKQ